jgi:two-component system cell cycle sensor histidine kinase PleC
VINDVLDLSKTEAGRYNLADNMVVLCVVVRSCMGIPMLRAAEGGVRIDNATVRHRATVHAHSRALKQMMINSAVQCGAILAEGWRGIAAHRTFRTGCCAGGDRYPHRGRGLAGAVSAIPASG